MYISYISSTGNENWSFRPNNANENKIEFLSLDSFAGTDYIWGCGHSNF